MWREKGAVGIDMETSALFSIADYLNLNIVSVLIVSVIHLEKFYNQVFRKGLSSCVSNKICNSSFKMYGD